MTLILALNPGSAMTGPVRSWRVALTNQDRTGLVNGRHCWCALKRMSHHVNVSEFSNKTNRIGEIHISPILTCLSLSD